jgi:ABC-type lipoprotein release transport system permease subunit
VGVLRAIGVTKCRMKMLYFYEASVLVLASCFLGVIVGMMVGYTMTL